MATPAAPRRSQKHVSTRPDEAADLLRRMAAGEEEALVALYARTAGLVHAVALRILGSREEAGDATAEVYWRIWTRAGSFDPGHCSAMAWILTVARRMALDRRRSLLRRGSAVERFRVEHLGETTEGGEEAMVSRVQASAVLSRLSERDRSLLESAYFEGLSGNDIALRDQLPLGTVKSRMRAALARLRLSVGTAKP